MPAAIACSRDSSASALCRLHLVQCGNEDECRRHLSLFQLLSKHQAFLACDLTVFRELSWLLHAMHVLGDASWMCKKHLPQESVPELSAKVRSM